MIPTPGALRYHANEARHDFEYWSRRAKEHDENAAFCRKEAIKRLKQAEDYEDMACRGEIVVEYAEAAE